MAENNSHEEPLRALICYYVRYPNGGSAWQAGFCSFGGWYTRVSTGLFQADFEEASLGCAQNRKAKYCKHCCLWFESKSVTYGGWLLFRTVHEKQFYQVSREIFFKISECEYAQFDLFCSGSVGSTSASTCSACPIFDIDLDSVVIWLKENYSEFYINKSSPRSHLTSWQSIYDLRQLLSRKLNKDSQQI